MKSEWKKCKIGDVCKKITDGSHFSPKGEKNGFPMLSVKDMREYGFDYSDCKYISQNDFIALKNSDCVPVKGDVLVAKDGSYLKQIFVCRENKDEAVLSSIAIFRPDYNQIFSEYLCYVLKSPNIYNYIKRNCVSGSALPRIILKAFRDVEITLPPLPTQKKIAAILSALDAKIENNNAINKNLEAQAQALYDSMACYGENVKLGTLIDCIETGSRPKGGGVQNGIPSIGAEKIEKFGVYDFSKETFIPEDFYNAMKRGHIKSGDVLLYKDGAYTGKCSMALNGFPYDVCAVNEHVFILRTKNKMYQNFLYCCLRDEVVSTQIYNLACGKAAQPGLNQNELRSVDIRLPKEDVLKNFERSVYEIMKMIANNALENTRLAALRDTLLPKLMSGEIEV